MLKIIEEIEEVKHWPSTTAEHVKCKVCAIDDTEKVFEVTLHKTEVKLIKMLNQIQKGANLYAHTMNELWKEIEEYGQNKYEEGDFNASSHCDGL